MLSEFSPEAVRRADLWEIVVNQLRHAIITRELPPGTHLQEPFLAKKFAISRVPVREALIRLENEGLVRSEPRRGAFVVGLSLTEIRELYEVRTLLEAHAGRLAAERAMPEDINLLDELVDLLDSGTKNKDAERLVEADIGFHRHIVSIAHHSRLFATWVPMAGIITSLMRLSNEARRDTSVVSSHRALATAIASHDADAAERLTRAALIEGLQMLEATWSSVVSDSGVPA